MTADWSETFDHFNKNILVKTAKQIIGHIENNRLGDNSLSILAKKFI